MVGWIDNVRPDNKISAEELQIRLKLMAVKQYLQDRRLQWFGHLEIWKRVPGLVNVEPSELLIVSLEDDLGKHGIR